MRCMSCWYEIESDPITGPMDAVAFSSHGNYGSKVWDPSSGSYSLRVYLCDTCLTALQKAGQVKLVREETHRREFEHIWDGEDPTYPLTDAPEGD